MLRQRRCRRFRAGTPSRRAGFSLIELLTVFVIAGILGMMSIGRISKQISQTKVQRAAQSLSNDLQAAFAIAARNRAPVRLVWDASRMKFSVTNRAQTVTFRSVTFGAAAGYNLRASQVTVYPTVPVEIFPNGLATDSLSFSINANGFSKRIRMTRAGLVQQM
jgi:prepilin-type N-terminal cleavage/methylation domain-containing protein